MLARAQRDFERSRPQADSTVARGA
jgi:hypothetical protein